jgi:nucleotide-binding universal stress UspA family protein
VRSLVIVLLVPVAVAAGGCGRAGKTGVKAGIEQLASISAEGALIAEGVARARTKTTFVRVHGEELSAQAEHEAEKLSDDPGAPALKPRIEKAIKLAGDIGGAIDDLRVSPHDPQQAREDEAKLRVWAQQAAALAETL